MDGTGKISRWSGQVVTPDDVLTRSAVIFSPQEILWVGPCSAIPEEWQGIPDTTPPGTKYILPGLIDVHCHGGGGASFPDSTTLEEVRQAAREHLGAGTTTLVASLVTAPIDILAERAGLLAEAAAEGTIAGIHFEGPFLSVARCGAQDPRYLIDPTVPVAEALVKAADGHGVSMTIAPERSLGTEERASLQVLVDGGIRPSWGHTDADLSQTRDAIEAGKATMAAHPLPGQNRATVTHLFNGMRPLHHREPGPIAEFLAAARAGEVVVEMICDGVHLDPELVCSIVDLVGRENCVFVTDAMAAAGMPDGLYDLGPQKARIVDGVARLDGGDSLAGGTARLIDCVRVATTKAGIALEDAVFMASTQGASIFGWDDVGAIEVGRQANLVAVDGDIDVVEVRKMGRTVA